MKISPARVSAFEILERIETERSYSSVLLPMYEEKLASNDRGLCHELVLGVLRRQIYLDRIIEQFAGAKKLDAAVRIALRLGIYQLLFLDKIPGYSAINESVNLVARAKKASAKGFVNAILRKVSKKIDPLEYADEIDRVSVETSHPRWLIEKWITDFGETGAAEIAAANNLMPGVALRFTGKEAEALDTTAFEKSEFVEGCYFARTIDAELRALADNGVIYLQDEASQLVAQLAGSDTSGSFLDVCAAPGGKTTQVVAKYRDLSGTALFVAGDLHASRVRLLRATCERQGVDYVNVVQYDAESSLPFADGTFATVLVDAPCSGTGTIRHNPELRYLLQPGDIPQLVSKQLAILKNASKVVKPGGRLIYSTCSLQEEENEGTVREFLGEVSGFDPVSPNVSARFITGRGFARTFPHRDGMDGFFIAELRRRSQ